MPTGYNSFLQKIEIVNLVSPSYPQNFRERDKFVPLIGEETSFLRRILTAASVITLYYCQRNLAVRINYYLFL